MAITWQRRHVRGITTAILLLAMSSMVHAQAELGSWAKIATIPEAKTHLVPRTWTLDKYPEAPTLLPHARVTLLDQEGPGVVTQLHVSNYTGGDASQLRLRVWYDHQEKPAIEMPLMDFLGDIEAAAKPYSTLYFSRVRASHNFRLPIPFRKHIRIEVENPTDCYLMGYMEVQWDEVQVLPKDCGYLKAIYRQGILQFPHEDLLLCDISRPGTIVAHWLQLQGDHPACANGQAICEANHEIYLDGDQEPTYESLGCEDFYGHSWGFQGMESDFHSAIVRHETTPQGGTLAAMVRTRDTDRITFQNACRIRLTYQHDLGEPYDWATRKGKAPALQPFVGGKRLEVPYRSCVYYYEALGPEE